MVAFLITHGYRLVVEHGDDAIYALPHCVITVKVPSRRSEVIHIVTMDNIRRCIRKCGFKNEDILNWWKENKYGD